MRKFLFALTLITGMIVIYKLYNPPRSGAELLVPVHTLERLGFNEGDLFFMMLHIGCFGIHLSEEHNIARRITGAEGRQ